MPLARSELSDGNGRERGYEAGRGLVGLQTLTQPESTESRLAACVDPRAQVEDERVGLSTGNVRDLTEAAAARLEQLGLANVEGRVGAVAALAAVVRSEESNLPRKGSR